VLLQARQRIGHDRVVTARNGEHGYGWVTKTLHWLTFGLLVAQFVVGYLMDDNGGGHGRGRGRGRGGDGGGSGHGRGRGGEDEVLDLLPVHVGLGLAILVLAVVRVFWRVSTPLPPWAESLSAGERRIAHHTERVLLVMLFVIPPTGLVVLLGDDDLLGLHIAAHIVFFVALATHLGLVLGRGLRGRPVLLRRML
jgi:cytochrome b561